MLFDIKSQFDKAFLFAFNFQYFLLKKKTPFQTKTVEMIPFNLFNHLLQNL